MRLDFFATKGDLLPAIEAFEDAHDVAYLLTGMFPSPDTEQYDSASEIPNLGTSVYGDSAGEKTFLIVCSHTEIPFREIKQRRGGELYTLDLDANPEWMSLKPAGTYEGGFVIPGGIGTTSNDPVAAILFKSFAREIRKRFTRIQDYYVGPEALKLMQSGWRLAYNTRTPEESDLRNDAVSRQSPATEE